VYTCVYLAAVANSETLSAKLTAKEAEQIEKLVKAGHYLNVSDFVRSAVREKLAQVNLHLVRPATLAQAKREILSYLREHTEAYPSDIAASLGLDLSVTMRAARELAEEDKIR
jgi:Arc/MetJ-type ribon-helix-helix transcriptional regulator